MHQIKTRNQKACDLCRARRVKCRPPSGGTSSDIGPGVGIPCEGCLTLGTSCTSDKPRRKRGPPNAHANDAYRRLNHNGKVHVPSPSSAEQPPRHSPLELLGPRDLVRHILDDWFEHIHPLAPVLLRRRFLARLDSDEADTNPVFAALVISVVCATCATLRRPSHRQTDYGSITTERCFEIVEAGPGLLPPHGPYSLDWCVAKYNLGASARAMPSLPTTHVGRYITDAQLGVRHLLHAHQAAEPCLPLIEVQLLKRLYWLLIVTDVSMDLTGRPVLGFVTIHDYTDCSRRPLPLTDDQLDPNNTAGDPWHGDVTSYVPALNHLADIFLAWHRAQVDRLYLSPNAALDAGLRRVQATLDRLPPELRWRGGLSRRSSGATIHHDAQIANLFITSLYVRSNMLQLFSSSASSSIPSLSSTPSSPQSFHGGEHQRLVGDLLEILRHLPAITLEANGCSLVPKIRGIGGAYLSELSDGGVLVAVDNDAGASLRELLRKLEVLDFTPGQSG
ncbi:RNA polymerase II-specific transcription factor-like protein [Microdochium nivale]|nr:RNA polymerase II-specific transcription factor-like protein [Microdochium nivale]